MKWQEVRELYPNQFVKFQIVEAHIIDDKKYVDELAFIKNIKYGREAMKEFRNCRENQFVYSTTNEKLIIHLVKYVGIRKSM
jgi:hypothetical protein